MEKYGRQLLADGLVNAEDIHITTDSELFLFGCRKNSTISPLDGLSNDIKVPGEILCSARPQEEVVALVLDFHLGVFIFQ